MTCTTKCAKERASRFAGLSLSVLALLGSPACSTDEINAVLIGVQAVADIVAESQDDDLNFADWLASELRD